jgi:LmbE family N-acetylglucosaminyl deacetylase
MNRHQRQTLTALFAHPLDRDLRYGQVEALFHALGAEVSHTGGDKLRIRFPDGQETWLHAHVPRGQRSVPADEIERLRHFLESIGITPQHPDFVTQEGEEGEGEKRLVLHLSHHQTDAFELVDDQVGHTVLKPYDPWGYLRHLHHEHVNEASWQGQRPPEDPEYLRGLTEAVKNASQVLLVGHGTGRSDMREVLLKTLRQHHPDLVKKIVGVVTVDETRLTDTELLTFAQEYFGGGIAQRQIPLAPGLPVE